MDKLDWPAIGALLAIPVAIVAVGTIAWWLWTLLRRKPENPTQGSPPPQPPSGPSAMVTASPTITVSPHIEVKVSGQEPATPAEPKPPPTTQAQDSLPSIGSGLPYGNPHFGGRNLERAQVIDHLLHDRSVLLHGEPGIGKTELAIQSLRSPEIQRFFKDRLYWFETTPDSLPSLCDEVARRINAQAVTGIADLDQKIQTLRANLGDPPPLLAFNNADGLAAAAVADFCSHVLPVPLLVTSRDAVPGLQRPELHPLRNEDALKLLTDYSRQPAAEESAKVQDILTFLDGNPQAIILTAGVFLDMSAADLLKALRSRPFDVVGPVRAAFDVSYERLSEPQQRLFAALGVFAGPDFSGDAVQALFEQDTTLDMARLCGVSLVRRDQATGRYSLHPLLKQYARDKVAGQERYTLQLRLAAFYAWFTSRHQGSDQHDLDAMFQEFLNIRGCVEWCIGSKEKRATPSFVAIVNSMAQFMYVRGHWTEIIKWGATAVDAARTSGDDKLLAMVMHNVGNVLQFQGRIEEAREFYQQSLEIKQRLGDQRGITSTLHQLGMLAHHQGRLEEARDLYQQSLEVAKRLGDQQGIASILHQSGRLAQDQGHIEEARDLYQQAKASFERLGDQQGIARTLHNLGALAQGQGRLEEARDLYQQSLEIKQRLGDQQGIAQTFHQLGMLAHHQGRLEEARDLYQQAKASFERLGDQQGIAITLHNLGALAQGQGRLEEARDLYQQSLEIEKRLGNQLGIAQTLGQLGRLDEDAGRLPEAQQQFAQALTIFERLGSPDAAIARRSLQRVEEKLKAKAS